METERFGIKEFYVEAGARDEGGGGAAVTIGKYGSSLAYVIGMYKYIHVYIYIYIYIYLYTSLSLSIYIYIYIYVSHSYIYIYIYIYIYTFYILWCCVGLKSLQGERFKKQHGAKASRTKSVAELSRMSVAELRQAPPRCSTEHSVISSV